jgi:hypothetical protein
MRVAMLVGVLMFDLMLGLYQSGWSGSTTASINEDGAQVRAMDDVWPPPPPPPSWP